MIIRPYRKEGQTDALLSVQGCTEPEQQDAAGSRSTAFHQTAPSHEAASNQVGERREEERRFRAGPGVRSSEEDDMASGGRRGGTDAATVAAAF